MNKRIAYKKRSEGVYESVSFFKSATTGAVYEVIIDTNRMVYKIKNVHTERIYEGAAKRAGEPVTNVRILKINARLRLEKFGVKFIKEGNKANDTEEEDLDSN